MGTLIILLVVIGVLVLQKKTAAVNVGGNVSTLPANRCIEFKPPIHLDPPGRTPDEQVCATATSLPRCPARKPAVPACPPGTVKVPISYLIAPAPGMPTFRCIPTGEVAQAGGNSPYVPQAGAAGGGSVPVYCDKVPLPKSTLLTKETIAAALTGSQEGAAPVIQPKAYVAAPPISPNTPKSQLPPRQSSVAPCVTCADTRPPDTGALPTTRPRIVPITPPVQPACPPQTSLDNIRANGQRVPLTAFGLILAGLWPDLQGLIRSVGTLQIGGTWAANTPCAAIQIRRDSLSQYSIIKLQRLAAA